MSFNQEVIMAGKIAGITEDAKARDVKGRKRPGPEEEKDGLIFIF